MRYIFSKHCQQHLQFRGFAWCYFLCLCVGCTSASAVNFEKRCKKVDIIINQSSPLVRSICEDTQRLCKVYATDKTGGRKNNPFQFVMEGLKIDLEKSTNRCFYTYLSTLQVSDRARALGKIDS